MENLKTAKHFVMSFLPVVLLTCLIVTGLYFIGTSDYEDELNSEKMYCDMVKEGTWKDFNRNYNEICKK